MFSLVYLLVWSPPPHIPYISSPNQCLLFAAHARTIAACFAVVSILCHLFLVFLLLLTWKSVFYVNITHPSDHSHLCSHILTIGKKNLNSNTSSTCPHNVVNFGPLSAEICWRVWGTPANFNGFCVLAALLHARHSSSGHQPNFAALNRGHHLYSTGRPSRWALAHILVWTCSTKYAPLIIVCMKLYHLLLDSVMICVSVSQAFAF